MTYLATISHPADLDGFRRILRSAIALDIAPEDLLWQLGSDPPPLLPATPLPEMPDAPPPIVPRRFVELAGQLICHRDDSRFALLHQAVRRLKAEPKLLADRADPLVDRMEGMAKSVARDMHKMQAFVRFREISDDEGPHFIAWFEPDHFILRANAGFFVRRHASQRWTILTPEESAHWDGEELHFLPGASPGDAPAGDPLEELWRRYYASTFNPARLKTKAMQSEMPRKYWRNLPEAQLIPQLVAHAGERTNAMIRKAQTDAAQPQPTVALTGSLKEVAEAAAGCTRCPLYAPATQTVFGEGPTNARLLIVGEQPGDQEDVQGRPFVGPAGQLLDRALVEAGIDRTQAYVTNAVKHFKFEPRGRRRIHMSPNSAEISACRWWLDQELDILKPGLVLMLGASAARAMMGRAVTVGRERGRLLELAGGRRGYLTVHPSYLLRIPDAMAKEAEHARFVGDLRDAAKLAEELAA